jgi:two-component system cell cycle sensor histidine kinase/response regulator CckA
LGKIRSSGRRAADLVGQLLAFSRKQVIQPQVLDLNGVVEDMDRMLQRIIGEDIELQTILTPDLWKVRVDPTQIEQVIVNLAVNARDAMPDGGRLLIETSNVVFDQHYVARHLEIEPGEQVLLAISDTGVGMSGEIKERIFEPFFTTKERGKGTGLGLATVFGIVKQNGGNIWCYSEEGIGTTFKVYLPRCTEEGDEPSSSQTKRDVPLGSEVILLVEDEEEVRDLAQRILQRQGYIVLGAECGGQALELAATPTGPIQMVLTDVVLPDMSGKQLTDQLAESRPHLEALYMSGYTDETIARHGVLKPGIAFLQKPFSAIDLARKVRRVLDKEA